MKTQLIKPLVFLILGCSAMIFQACKNGGDYVDTNAIYLRHVDSLKQYSLPLEGRFWRIRSQFLVHGTIGAKIPIDSCNMFITYYFGSRNRNPNTGYVWMNYNNSSCPRNFEKMRTRNPDTLSTSYYIDIHPNILRFMDNGYDATEYQYSILKLKSDSLVLQRNTGDTVITKIYTPAK